MSKAAVGHLHSHGRPSPRWSARMSLFGLEPHNTNPRIHCNERWVWGGERSKVRTQSNTSKCITAIHKSFTHSHYLPIALKLPLIHLSIAVRGTQRPSRPPQSTSHSLQKTHTHTWITILAQTFPWLHPFLRSELKPLH